MPRISPPAKDSGLKRLYCSIFKHSPHVNLRIVDNYLVVVCGRCGQEVLP